MLALPSHINVYQCEEWDVYKRESGVCTNEGKNTIR